MSLYYNESNSFLVNGVKICHFKVKSSEIHASPLCLSNISKGFSVDNMKKLGLYGYVYRFSVDYDSIDVSKYFEYSYILNKKHNIK